MDYMSLVLQGAPQLAKAGKKVVVPLAAGGTMALVAAAKGAIDLRKGHRVRDEATERLNLATSQLNDVELKTELIAREYGEYQIEVHAVNVVRFADWLERNQAQVKRLRFKKVSGVRIRLPNIPKYAAGVRDIKGSASAVVSAVGAGAAAPAAALWGVSAFATAGTGAAISGLSGAAATNATLAALGGGTIAAGGGGMAAGAAVLGLTAAVPALLVGGLTVAIVAEKSKTKSRKFAEDVDTEIQRMELTKDLLHGVQYRLVELRGLLEKFAERASAALEFLESVDFDAEKHANEFLRTFQLVTAVKEILNTPVLDLTTGQLSEASIKILRKYA